MAFIPITKIEDIKDTNCRYWLLAVANVFFNGDIEATIKDYNETNIKLEELEKKSKLIQNPPLRVAHINLKQPGNK